MARPSEEYQRIEHLIQHVMDRLPRDVAQFVDSHCRVSIVERHIFGITVQTESAWQLIFNLGALAHYYQDTDDVLSVIAHEIAHAWLGHIGYPPVASEQDTEHEHEDAAARQVAEWGFPGKAARPFDER